LGAEDPAAAARAAQEAEDHQRAGKAIFNATVQAPAAASETVNAVVDTPLVPHAAAQPGKHPAAQILGLEEHVLSPGSAARSAANLKELLAPVIAVRTANANAEELIREEEAEKARAAALHDLETQSLHRAHHDPLTADEIARYGLPAAGGEREHVAERLNRLGIVFGTQRQDGYPLIVHDVERGVVHHDAQSDALRWQFKNLLLLVEAGLTPITDEGAA